MKLKNAIILGIGFSIGKFIFNFTVQFVDRAVDLGNDILDVMQNDGLSFEKSVDKVLSQNKLITLPAERFICVCDCKDI